MGAVIANAIYDAVGARVLQLPMTPARILAAIELSEERLEEAAARRHIEAASYREYLQREYHRKIMTLKKETPEGDS